MSNNGRKLLHSVNFNNKLAKRSLVISKYMVLARRDCKCSWTTSVRMSDPASTLLQPIFSVSSYWFLIAVHIQHSKAHLSLAGGESSGSCFTTFRTAFSRLPSFTAANDFLWFLSTCRDSEIWSLDFNLFLSGGGDDCGGPFFRLADKSLSSCSEGDLENNYTFRSQELKQKLPINLCMNKPLYL